MHRGHSRRGPRLKELANVYYDINVAKLNRIIRTLTEEHVREVTMLGKVTKEWLFKGLHLPDMRALKLLNRLRNRKDDTIMLAIVDELAKDGISVLDQTKYLKPLMPGPQVFTKKKAYGGSDEGRGVRLLHGKDAGRHGYRPDRGGEESGGDGAGGHRGTDACIRRGGELGRGGAVVVKTAKPKQDTRFDVPAVGLQTLHSMIESGCSVLAIEAYRTLFAEKDAVIQEADRKGIVILSVEQGQL